jgi:hypothetical protein
VEGGAEVYLGVNAGEQEHPEMPDDMPEELDFMQEALCNERDEKVPAFLPSDQSMIIEQLNGGANEEGANKEDMPSEFRFTEEQTTHWRNSWINFKR